MYRNFGHGRMSLKHTAIKSVERLWQPSWNWVLACAGILLLLAVLGSVTGPVLTLGPLYVIPVILATWFAGLQRGLPVALGAVAAWLWGHHPAPASGGVDAYVLNTLVRAGAYVAVAFMLAGMRSALLTNLPRVTGPDCINGIFPASQFREIMSLELDSACRNALPLSCAYLEVSDFRLVSERHGPKMAILVLSALGRSIRNCLRRADVVGRLGAERFLVVLPETRAADVGDVVQRLRTEFTASTRFCPTRVDLGIAVLSYDVPPATLDDLIRDVKALATSRRTNG
jgi:diguanylate cyclase (GGDEF)-like protein